MHLFNAAGKITKYDEPTDIIDEFYPLRLEFYEKRKASRPKTMNSNQKPRTPLENPIPLPEVPHSPSLTSLSFPFF